MTVTINRLGPRSIEVKLLGRLDRNDYEFFTPHAEAAIEKHGELNLLIHVPDTLSFTPAALWEDLKFDARHFNDVGRIAIVSGDSTKSWLATVSKPFTAAEVRFFEGHELNDARKWLRNEAI